ncbi:MAG: phosphoglycerate dehydrogenase [Roseiflexaceae bacterium]
MIPLHSYRILVTPTSFGKGDAWVRHELEAQVGEVIYNPTDQPLSSAALQQLLPGCHGMIAGLDTIDAAALAVADQLRVIARYGAGVDRIDLAAARERGIVVTNTPSANAVSVAELTIGLILACLRSIPMADHATKAGQWPRLQGISLQGKTVGLIGFGAIGRHVARRLQGFECQILAYDPLATADLAATYRVTFAPLAEVIARAEIVSLHVPALPGTRGMVDAAFLAAMQPGAFLINTARGELIDEAALAAALQCGQLRGAALDAFATEPPDPASPLMQAPNLITTPHTGAHTDGAIQAMGRGALHDCLAVLRGEAPTHRVI